LELYVEKHFLDSNTELFVLDFSSMLIQFAVELLAVVFDVHYFLYNGGGFFQIAVLIVDLCYPNLNFTQTLANDFFNLFSCDLIY
jgi:hypothetical protein